MCSSILRRLLIFGVATLASVAAPPIARADFTGIYQGTVVITETNSEATTQATADVVPREQFPGTYVVTLHASTNPSMIATDTGGILRGQDVLPGPVARDLVGQFDDDTLVIDICVGRNSQGCSVRRFVFQGVLAPFGACALTGTFCASMQEIFCDLSGGDYLGNNATCGEAGACTLDEECSLKTQAGCAAIGGTFGGAGTRCPLGQTIRWNNPAGGSFGIADNWDPQRVPVHETNRSDTAQFDLASTAPVIVTATNATAGRWRVQGMPVDLLGTANVLGNDVGGFALEISDAGKLSVVSGSTLTTADALIGASTSPNESRVLVSGPGSRWNTGELFLGGDAPGSVLVADEGSLVATAKVDVGAPPEDGLPATLGTLEIADGGSVHTPTAVAAGAPGTTIIVRGVGVTTQRSSLRVDQSLTIGAAGGPSVHGDLIVDAGGTVEAGVVVIRSTGSTGQASATITGASGTRSSALRATSTTGHALVVAGFESTTQLDVRDGGQLRTVSGAIARHGRVLVQNPDSNLPPFDETTGTGGAAWIASAPITINGDTEPGALTIESRGLVVAPVLHIGVVAGETGGTATIDDAGSLLVVGDLRVGAAAPGAVLVIDGGRLETISAAVGDTADLGANPAAVAESSVVVESGVLTSTSWENAGDLEVGRFANRPGTIRLASLPLFLGLGPTAMVQVGGTLTVGPGGAVVGNGTLATGARVVNGGIIGPGLSPGHLTIAGDYVQGPTGRLVMEVGGLGPGEMDVLDVSGKATLGGTLELRFVDGFVPHAGDVLPILPVGGKLKGGFAAVEVKGLAPGFDYGLGFANGAFGVTAIRDGAAPTCGDPADGDQDGVADCSDVCPTVADPMQADGDGDGRGDGCDPCRGGMPVLKPLLSLKKGVLAFKGKLVLPAAGTLAPATTGVRLLLTDGSGAVVLDAIAPAGIFDPATKAGWKGLGFKSPTGAIAALALTQKKEHLDEIGFKVAARLAAPGGAALVQPLTATLVLEPTSVTSPCGDARFIGPPAVNPTCRLKKDALACQLRKKR